MHARQRHCSAGIDSEDIGAGVRAWKDRNMLHARHLDIGNKLAAASDEPPVFFGPPFARNVAVIR